MIQQHLEFFLFFQALITFFISGGLFFKENSFKNKSIAVYFFVFAIEILYFIYATTEIANLYPDLYGRLYFSLGLIYGPLLWFHFKSVIHKKQTFRRFDLWHFLPILILNIVMFNILIMPQEERIAYFNSSENFDNFIIYLNYARALHQIVYAIALYVLFWKEKNAIHVNEKFYLSGLSIIYISTTLCITLLTLFANGWKDFSWYYIVCNVFVLLIVFILYKEPKFFKTLKEKYQNSRLSDESMMLIKSRIQNLFTEEKVYLDNSFSVDALATKLGVKAPQISQTFTNIFNESFRDYVNKSRVEHSKQLLMDEGYRHLKIEAIAQESGFNNKVTFYKAFSKFANTTPSQFRKQYVKT